MKYNVLQEELHSCLHVDYDFHLEKLKDNFILDFQCMHLNIDVSKIYMNRIFITYFTYIWSVYNGHFFKYSMQADLQQDDIYYLLTKYKYPYNKYHAIELIDNAIERYIIRCEREEQEMRERFITEHGYDPDEPQEFIVLYDFQNTEDILFTMTTENYGFLEDYPELE